MSSADRSIGDEIGELGCAGRVAKLLKCLGFDLTNPLAGYAEFLADLFEGMISRAIDAKAHAQDALLS